VQFLEKRRVSGLFRRISGLLANRHRNCRTVLTGMTENAIAYRSLSTWGK